MYTIMTIETNIGSQCWFAENLRTARYRNGEPEHWVTNESGFNGLPGGPITTREDSSAWVNKAYGGVQAKIKVLENMQ